jgi:hypothetical protein
MNKNITDQQAQIISIEAQVRDMDAAEIKELHEDLMKNGHHLITSQEHSVSIFKKMNQFYRQMTGENLNLAY